MGCAAETGPTGSPSCIICVGCKAETYFPFIHFRRIVKELSEASEAAEDEWEDAGRHGVEGAEVAHAVFAGDATHAIAYNVHLLESLNNIVSFQSDFFTSTIYDEDQLDCLLHQHSPLNEQYPDEFRRYLHLFYNYCPKRPFNFTDCLRPGFVQKNRKYKDGSGTYPVYCHPGLDCPASRSRSTGSSFIPTQNRPSDSG